MALKLEMNKEFAPTDTDLGVLIPGLAMMTPAIGDKDYWILKVQLTPSQAIIGFPKFGTIGIGYMVEKDDWNTNLPYLCTTQEIFNHIKKNKGDPAISDENCIEAIKMIQAAAKKYMAATEVEETLKRR